MKHKTHTQESEEAVAVFQTGEDFRNALLVISLVVNLFVLVSWLVVETTDRYDAAVVSLLFK
jgi:hypothetical protein